MSSLKTLPELDEKSRAALRFDLVTDTHSRDTIGRRYGLGGEAGLDAFLWNNPAFAQDVERLRALFASDMNATERARLKALLASEELVGDIYAIVSDRNAPPSLRIDGFKQLNRMGGVDGIAPAGKSVGEAHGGNQFVVNFHLGERVETIRTTVIEQKELPKE